MLQKRLYIQRILSILQNYPSKKIDIIERFIYIRTYISIKLMVLKIL